MRLSEDNTWPYGLRICEKTLYNWIEVGDISNDTIVDLPGKGKMKHKKGNKTKRRHSNIDKRPVEANERIKVGHWERNTVYSTKFGSKECLLTLVERKTRFEIIMKIATRTAGSATGAINKLEKQLGSRAFREIFKSITFDNGVELSDVAGLEHSYLTRLNRTQLFFAHPYCTSEIGTNENHNGIIRRFLPKGTDFSLIKDETLKEVQNWMNNYPRKILNGFTPLMVFK